MSDDRSRLTNSRPPLPRRVRVRPIGWVPGEMFASVHVVIPPVTEPTSVVTALRERFAEILGDSNIPVEKPEEDQEPALLLPVADSDRQLLFVPLRLGIAEPRVMRLAVAALNRLAGSDLGHNATLQAATPNWFGAAQDCCGGSPGSQPVPAEPFGERVRYAPQLAELDLVERATAAGDAPHVAVLDTAPDRSDVDWAVEQFPDNRHLQELLHRLVPPLGAFAPSPVETARQQALQRLEQNGGFRPIEPAHTFDIRDHGLFVAGVLHATAPWAHIRLIRVLNNFGVGSLHSLVIGLVGLLQSKPADERLVINLSLGMLPALEQLASVWFGLAIDGLPGCPENAELQFLPDRPDLSPAEVKELVKRNDASIRAIVDALHAPLLALMEALEQQNCLVVAAAGNDSVFRGIERRPRWSPRIPAVYDTVLGVAGAVRPGVPARYSNRGERPAEPVRDAVATLGGDLAPDGVSPLSGVIGVYTAEQFPPLLPPAPPAWNTTGWAEWSGTSFATPIMAGIAANVWATRPGMSAAQVIAELNDAARDGGRPDVADLGVPGLPVRLTWLP
jgi:hypothetical protein